MATKTTQILIAIGILIIALFGYAKYAPAKYDSFATCLTENDATFYGAFWCPHCLEQKKAFGASIKNVLYVECSTPDGKGQLQVCKDAGVESYPTWEFADKSRLTGFIDFETLSKKTGCPLP